MLTSYAVKCPHPGCNWRGNRIPRVNNELWHGQMNGKRTVVEFECPRCGGEWQAQVVGDDVRPLPVQQPAATR